MSVPFGKTTGMQAFSISSVDRTALVPYAKIVMPALLSNWVSCPGGTPSSAPRSLLEIQ
jgi:hypothetical protein